jgi:hypothetical protein
MIALQPGDEAVPFGLPDLDEILSRQLQCGLARFGPAGCVEHMRKPVRSRADQGLGQSLGRFGGEEAAIGKGQPVNLAVNGGDDLGVTVAEARHC